MATYYKCLTTVDNATSSTTSIYTTGYTKSILIDGDSNTYYPVVISGPYDKNIEHTISIWKNLGSTTASYSGNHSNGTSSMWAIYKGRYNGWDGNGGFWSTYYLSEPYNNLIEHAEVPRGIMGGIIAWLRGGGTSYNISCDLDISVKVFYDNDSNLSENSTYQCVRSPMAAGSGNGGNLGGIYYYGKSASSANSDNATYATTAGSAPASDVYSWAKASTKPSYSYGDEYLSGFGSAATYNADITLKNLLDSTTVGGFGAFGGSGRWYCVAEMTISNNNNATATFMVTGTHNYADLYGIILLSSRQDSGTPNKSYFNALVTHNLTLTNIYATYTYVSNIFTLKLWAYSNDWSAYEFTRLSYSGWAFPITKGFTVHNAHNTTDGYSSPQGTKFCNGNPNNLTIQQTATYATTAGSAPASDVYAWAKASTKPSYTYSEVGAAAASHTHSYLPLSGGTLTGSLTATAFYESSDIRYKNIQSYISPKLEDIANLPIFDFTWKDSTSDSLHTGTSAQAVLLILPNIVTDTEKLLLDYGALGAVSSIVIARKVVELQKQIEYLTNKISLLELLLNNK